MGALNETAMHAMTDQMRRRIELVGLSVDAHH